MKARSWIRSGGLALLGLGAMTAQAMGEGDASSVQAQSSLPSAETGTQVQDTASSTAPIPVAASAPEAIKLEASGYFFSRFERRIHYGSEIAPSADFVRYRAQLGLRTQRIPIDGGRSVQVRFSPQVGGFWSTGGDTLEDPTLGVHEAAVKLSGARGTVEVGRFEMSYGDELVIGAVGWHHIGRAFDGIRVRLSDGKDGAWVDAFATQLTEGTLGEVTSGALGAQDRYFVGAYSGLGPLVGALDLDLYGLSMVSPGYVVDESSFPTAVELTVGARLKGKAGRIDHRIEAGAQVGVRRVETAALGVLAFQGDAELGFTLPVAHGLRLGLEGFYATGDEPTTDRIESWNQLFPTAHKWLGYMDVVGPRTNVMGGVLHLKLSPTARWSFLIDAHRFYRPLPAEGTEPYVGTEIDTGLSFALSKAFAVRGAYDLFLQPEGAADSRLHFMELEISSRF